MIPRLIRFGNAAVIAAVAAAFLVAGCGAQDVAGTASGDASGSAGASTKAGGGTTKAGTPKCVAADMSAALEPGSPGAGQQYATLVLTNKSKNTCTMEGYGGLGLYDAAGKALPTSAQRTSPPGPSLVSLAPGAKAKNNLHWSTVPGQGEPTTGPCQPSPATLKVIPPDDTQQVSVAWTFGPVCSGGRIDGSAYYK